MVAKDPVQTYNRLASWPSCRELPQEPRAGFNTSLSCVSHSWIRSATVIDVNRRRDRNGMTKRWIRELITLLGGHLNEPDCPRRMDKRELRRSFPKGIRYGKLTGLLWSPRVQERVIEDTVYGMVGELQV